MLSPIEYPDHFTAEECASIITLAKAGTFADGELVGGARNADIRRARIAWLPEDENGAWIFRRLAEGVAEANRSHFRFDIEEFAERAQVAYYGAGTKGFFDWHSDVGDGPLARRRKLTIVVQLSAPETYDGGDLEMNGSGHIERASRARGTAILLPSFILHRVSPVTRNERYSLTLWAHGPEFR